MSKINWARVFLCGIVAGVVWHLLAITLLSLIGGDLLAAMQSSRQYAPTGGLFFFSVDLLMGIWTVWLYAALRPIYGPGMKTVAVTGMAWWFMKSLESVKWVAIGFIPAQVVLVPLAATIPAMLIAAAVGAWLYRSEREALGSLAVRQGISA